jgi:4-hydroxy-tetrahydrodipicolinate reductase
MSNDLIRVGVLGARGRMGLAVVQAVVDDPQLDLVASLDQGDSLDGLVDGGAQVVVDFTVAAAARDNLRFISEHGMHAVVGTTGFTDDDLATFDRAFTSSTCLIAANFAIGAVLMMKFAEMAAPYFDSAEIIELHHDAKIDAPSGTAMKTVERMAAASTSWSPDPTQHEVLPGARGGKGPADIRVHSVRLRGLVAHQEVLLGTTGQTLSIRHDSIDRTSFMPGVVLACKRVSSLGPGVQLGLDQLLF